MKTKIKTNMDVVEEFMNWGSPLNQAFLMNAVYDMAKKIVDNEEEVLKQMENHFVYGPAWVQCAKDWLKLHDTIGNWKEDE